MASRALIILSMAWVLCCPALCAVLDPGDPTAHTETSHGTHEHEHACFCKGAALPTGLRATAGQLTDQLSIAIAAPVLGELPEIVPVVFDAGGDDPAVPPVLPGTQPLLI